MLEINKILVKLEGFQYATSLDLNPGCYHIQRSEIASNLCTIILPWENIIINVYQWDFPTHQTFSNRK